MARLTIVKISINPVVKMTDVNDIRSSYISRQVLIMSQIKDKK